MLSFLQFLEGRYRGHVSFEISAPSKDAAMSAIYDMGEHPDIESWAPAYLSTIEEDDLPEFG